MVHTCNSEDVSYTVRPTLENNNSEIREVILPDIKTQSANTVKAWW